jgi:divinyl chlorophyllide a 8-vinyl-reductase
MKSLTKFLLLITLLQIKISFCYYNSILKPKVLSKHYSVNIQEIQKNLPPKRVVVVGSTGYIGKFVVREAVRRGYETVAVVRSGANINEEYLNGASIVYGDVTDQKSLENVAFNKETDVVISCLASRSGVKLDSFLIDYQATLNALNAAKSNKVKHFILLSAFCVRKPLLQFQLAKLKFEKELEDSVKDIKFSIVRPTAFFKSVSGQFELLQQVFCFLFFFVIYFFIKLHNERIFPFYMIFSIYI